jgi:hypothetical protein
MEGGACIFASTGRCRRLSEEVGRSNDQHYEYKYFFHIPVLRKHQFVSDVKTRSVNGAFSANETKGKNEATK